MVILIAIVLFVIGVKSQYCEYHKKSSKKVVAQKGHYITAIREMNLLTFPLLFVGWIEATILIIIPIIGIAILISPVDSTQVYFFKFFFYSIILMFKINYYF